MTLVEKIGSDLTAAMKARDEAKVSTLRMLKAALMNAALQKKKELLDDSEVVEVIRKTLKQHQESQDAFEKGGRKDLADKEAREAGILKGYMPAEMGDDELNAIVQGAIKESGASGPAAMGQVMKLVLPKVQGKADGKRVSQLVGQLLQGK